MPMIDNHDPIQPCLCVKGFKNTGAVLLLSRYLKMTGVRPLTTATPAGKPHFLVRIRSDHYQNKYIHLYFRLSMPQP